MEKSLAELVRRRGRRKVRVLPHHAACFKRCKEKNILSSVGHIAVPRRYYACRHCRAQQTPWESWAGVTGVHRRWKRPTRWRVSPRKRRTTDRKAECGKPARPVWREGGRNQPAFPTPIEKARRRP